MSVRRIWEAPRVTCRTATRSGRRSTRSATQVDADLVAGDVRLTQGGEPTFVSIDDREGGEWNTEAIGPTKRDPERRADASGCAQNYAPGGLLHFGQGKWYPGRAAAALVAEPATGGRTASRSGTTRALIADEHERLRRDRGDEPGSSSSALAMRLGVDRDQRLPGVRGRLVLPLARAQAAGERRSASIRAWTTRSSARGCAGCSSAASTTPVGYALPIARVDERRPRRWLLEPLVPARRALLPGPGRFAARLPPAARLAAVGARRGPCPGSIAPDPTQHLPTLPPRAPISAR